MMHLFGQVCSTGFGSHSYDFTRRFINMDNLNFLKKWRLPAVSCSDIKQLIVGICKMNRCQPQIFYGWPQRQDVANFHKEVHLLLNKLLSDIESMTRKNQTNLDNVCEVLKTLSKCQTYRNLIKFGRWS